MIYWFIVSLVSSSVMSFLFVRFMLRESHEIKISFLKTKDAIGDLLHERLPLLVLAPAPRCSRCGHTPCPCCESWCDVIVSNEEDEDDWNLCCDGECDFHAASLDHWKSTFRIDEACRIAVAEGPFQEVADTSPSNNQEAS